MKASRSKEFIAYASACVSFILPKVEAEEIILFGSGARGDFDTKSDVDIFINVRSNERQQKEIERISQKELGRFYESRVYETWKLKGIARNIHLLVGNLDEWKLKRSIIANGIVLYGPYKSMPGNTKAFTQFVLQPIKNITVRNNVIRMLFGRKEKKYTTEGLVTQRGGKKLSSLSFIVLHSHTQEIIRFLNKHNVRYIVFEFWTDAF